MLLTAKMKCKQNAYTQCIGKIENFIIKSRGTEWDTKKYRAFRFASVLATVLISVFTLCYGPGLLFRGPPAQYTGKIQNCIIKSRGKEWATKK